VSFPTWTPGEARAAPRVIAHRGLCAGVEENTLEAFARAREAGADGIELDVRLAADGEPVVVHDHDLERLAGRRERIDAMTSGALADVKLTRGGSIPRLAEVLAATPDQLVNVELKSPRQERIALRSPAADRLVDAVIRCVEAELGEAAEGASRVLVSSFDPLAVARLRARRPCWLAALLFHREQAFWLRWAAAASVIRPAALHPEVALATPEAVRRWRRRGYLVHPWTVNDPAAARALAAAGASALITDDPARVREALR
jgi:glycerophosphoryl diester phosphodiesterase